MALTPRLDLRQVQTLVMTPQLQQAIKLLQLSNLELADYLDEELEKNPLLQQEDQSSGAEDESQNPEIQEPDLNGSPDTEVDHTGFEDGFDTSDITDLIGTKT
ncbi:MAG: RNA polymerase sigma-54 factor, partial [Rhodospirillaceae bacterium]